MAHTDLLHQAPEQSGNLADLCRKLTVIVLTLEQDKSKGAGAVLPLLLSGSLTGKSYLSTASWHVQKSGRLFGLCPCKNWSKVDMSNCSCGGSCGCSVGPCIKIDNLLVDEQVVTTVARSKIKPPDSPKKPTGPTAVQVIVYVYVSIVIAITIKYVCELQAKIDVTIPPPGNEWVDPTPHPQPSNPPPYSPPDSPHPEGNVPRPPCIPYEVPIC